MATQSTATMAVVTFDAITRTFRVTVESPTGSRRTAVAHATLADATKAANWLVSKGRADTVYVTAMANRAA